MRLRRIQIENYKCFRRAHVKLHDFNCVIGENSSGKTALMEALELTLGSEKRPTSLHYHDLDLPVQIALEFTDLAPREASLFADFLQDDRLALVWRWSQRGGTRPEITSLPKESLDSSRISLEDAAKHHQESVPRHLVSSLPAFYQIPPVYSFDDVLKSDDRADPLSRGISKPLLDASKELRKQIHSTVDSFRSSHRLGDLDELEDIADVISAFQQITIEPQVFVDGDFDPSIGLHLAVYDGIESDLIQKGHGLQRLMLYGQLIATMRQQRRERQARGKPPRSYLIGLEEIELYLHPTYQSIMLNQLRSIASREQSQVVYTSHSPAMIDMFDLESVIRLGRLEDCSIAYQIEYEGLAERVNALLGKSVATGLSVRERIGEVLSIETCQSLFARQVIIVEGNTERYALPELFGTIGFEFQRRGIAIVSAGGKGNIDKLVFLMEAFGIPYFVIFDQDASNADSASRTQSKNLRKLLHIPSEWKNFTVGKGYCVFEEDFEETFSSICPIWTELDREARQLLGLRKNSGKSLRAKYVSRRVAALIQQKDPKTAGLRSFLELLCSAISREG